MTDWSPYNLNTFGGRFMHYFKVVNPMNAFVTEKTIVDYYHKVKEMEKRTDILSEAEAEELLQMRYLLASSMHPDLN